MTENTVQISVRVSRETRDRFKSAVAYHKTTTQDVLERAIVQYLDKHGMVPVSEVEKPNKSQHPAAG